MIQAVHCNGLGITRVGGRSLCCGVLDVKQHDAVRLEIVLLVELDDFLR